jgi:hypothetical protein
MGTWWSEHPDLESLARRGRRAFTEELAAAEHDTELLRRRRRSLVDVCFEWMSRGDRVTVAVAGTQFEGELIAVVNDLALLRTRTLDIGFNLNAVDFVRSNQRAAFTGTSGERTVSSFRALLGKFEVEELQARLVGRDKTFDLTGVIGASTEDHVIVVDGPGNEWALPRNRIAYVIGPTSGSR